MKRGINSEPHAKQKFKQFFKKTHQNPEVSDPGITVFKCHRFTSVSPDLWKGNVLLHLLGKFRQQKIINT